jgi:excisionase family DNA binding protein
MTAPMTAPFEPVRLSEPARPTVERLLLDTNDVAYALHIGLSSARGLMARGELPSLRVGDRRLVRREDLMKFIEERATAAI